MKKSFPRKENSFFMSILPRPASRTLPILPEVEAPYDRKKCRPMRAGDHRNPSGNGSQKKLSRPCETPFSHARQPQQRQAPVRRPQHRAAGRSETTVRRNPIRICRSGRIANRSRKRPDQMNPAPPPTTRTRQPASVSSRPQGVGTRRPAPATSRTDQHQHTAGPPATC